MMKAFSVLQTLLFLVLTPSLAGFNIPLTFPADSSGRQETPGKVNQERLIAKNDYQIKTVVIDPGHGGHDPGCLGSDSQEKHLALGVGQKLAEAIRRVRPDIRVIMTRDEDVFIPLYERAAIANRNQADLFISIHCNFMPGRSDVKGSETYVMGLHTAEHNLEVAKRENEAILLEDDYEKNYDYDPNSPEGHIILSMYQNAFLEQSILFAELVEQKIKEDARRHSRGVKQAGFVVLKETAMPSVLVETGFLSNRSEEDFLQTDAGQQAVATALLNAFLEYSRVMGGPMEGEEALAALPPSATPSVSVASPSRPAQAQPVAVAAAATETPPPAVSPSPVVASPDLPKTAEPVPVKVETERRIIPLQYGDSPPPDRAAEMPGNTPPARVNQAPVYPAESFIYFAVQLAASPGPINTDQPLWQNLGYLVEVLQEDNLYKYQARNFATLERASVARSELRERGFPDAFIVAYKNGRRIDMEQARQELGY